MTEILWHGRGGQGAFTAARLLGAAFTLRDDHSYALAFPSFGPERRGAPVRQLLGLPLDGSGDRMYSALLRMAVWLAVCLVLRRELWACLRSFSSPPRRRGAGIQEEARLHRRLALLLLLGTLPMIPALLPQEA